MAPKAGFSRTIIKWGLQKVYEGQRLLEQQPGYDLIAHCLDQMVSKRSSAIMAGLERGPDLATTTSNRFKKVIMEAVAAETDIKPFWEVKTYNKKLEQQSDIAGKLSTHWYLNTNADQRGLATALRWAKIAGTGYIHLFWDPKAVDYGDFVAEGIDPRDVLPIGAMPPWDTTQNWDGVIVRQKRTVEYVRDLAGDDLADLIQADRGAEEGGPLEGTRAGRILSEINAQTRSPIAEVLFSDQPKTDIGRQPTVDLFTMYINDRSMNESSGPVEMGQFIEDPTWAKPEGVMGLFAKAPRIPANNWSYIVKPNDPLYPRKRMVVFTRSAVIYDGPSIYWHGKFPVLKLTPDPWPTTLLGMAVGWDLLSLQGSLDWNLRVIDDHNAQVANPMVIGDEMSIGKAALNKINTRRAGLKVSQNPMGKGITIVPPPPLDRTIREHIDWIMREMDDLAGVIDLKNLSGLNQIPDTETIDKMIEAKSWLVQGRSRTIEAFMREFAHQVLYNLSQFRTIKEKYTIGGIGFVTPEDFDFDPGVFIPDYVHSDDFDSFGNLTKDAFERGPLPRYERAKEVMRHMHFYIAPGSLLAASDVTRKMLYLQLFRGGILDVWTLAEVMGIPNMGAPPDGAKTIPERLMAQMSMGLMGAPNPANPSNPGPGRKPTAQTSPHIEKGGAVMSES
jgi:hypothetical protein